MKGILFIALMFNCFFVKSQNRNFSSYPINLFLINPAFTELKAFEYNRTFFIYKNNQVSGIDLPETFILASFFNLNMKPPRWNKLSKVLNLGIAIQYDKYGAKVENEVKGNFTYHIFNSKYKLSLSTNIGYRNLKFNRKDFLEKQWTVDSINNHSYERKILKYDIGLRLAIKKLKVGFSALNYSSTETYIKPTLICNSIYELTANKKIGITPGILLYSKVNIGLNYNILFDYNKKYYVGYDYGRDLHSLLVGLSNNNREIRLNLNYSLALNNNYIYSHEVSLNVLLKQEVVISPGFY